MEITIKHRCGTERTFWIPAGGGYVRVVTPELPGTLAPQAFARGGVALYLGEQATEADLRRAGRRHVAAIRDKNTCACGFEAGHDYAINIDEAGRVDYWDTYNQCWWSEPAATLVRNHARMAMFSDDERARIRAAAVAR